MTNAPPAAADPLYDLAPAAFVAARNALAKELRAAGDKATAAAVAQLRRPTPLAGALNRVARHDPAVLDAALDAGAALRQATDAAVAGDATELRPATATDRAATRAALAEAVASILGTAAADLVQQVTATVRAAVTSPTVADDVRAGRLSTDLGSGGFGLGELPPDEDLTTAAPVDDLAPRRKAKQAKVDQAAREEAQRAAEERRAHQRLEAEHRKRLEHLDSRARRLAQKAADAEQAAVDARAAADAAAAELARTIEEGP